MESNKCVVFYHMKILRETGEPIKIRRVLVIPPFLERAKSRGQAARASFCFGVIPPGAMSGQS
jgi:hypothetical protein